MKDSGPHIRAKYSDYSVTGLIFFLAHTHISEPSHANLNGFYFPYCSQMDFCLEMAMVFLPQLLLWESEWNKRERILLF